MRGDPPPPLDQGDEDDQDFPVLGSVPDDLESGVGPDDEEEEEEEEGKFWSELTDKSYNDADSKSLAEFGCSVRASVFLRDMEEDLAWSAKLYRLMGFDMCEPSLFFRVCAVQEFVESQGLWLYCRVFELANEIGDILLLNLLWASTGDPGNSDNWKYIILAAAGTLSLLAEFCARIFSTALDTTAPKSTWAKFCGSTVLAIPPCRKYKKGTSTHCKI